MATHRQHGKLLSTFYRAAAGVVAVLPFFSFSVLCSCIVAVSEPSAAVPHGALGIIDLSGWDFKVGGLVDLDGEWEFYWNSLIPAKELCASPAGAAKTLRMVPGVWNRAGEHAPALPVNGYATYSLTLSGVTPGSPIALFIPEMSTAYRMWLDTVFVASNGVVAESRDSTVPKYMPQAVIVFPCRTDARLTIHVANFHGIEGGMPRSIVAGDPERLMRSTITGRIFNGFMIGALMIISLYFCGIYALGKREPILLHLGMLVTVLIIKVMAVGDRAIVQLFPSIPWEVIVKTEVVPTYLGVAFYTNFLYTLYPQEVGRRMFRLVFLVSIFLSVLMMLLPSTLMLSINPFTYHLRIVSAIYGMYALVLAAIRRRDGAVILSMGFFFQLLVNIHETLVQESVVEPFYLVHVGVLIFSLFAAGVINRRFIQAEHDARTRRDQFAHTEILAALGTVVAGVTHEINNPNTSIQLDAQTQKTALIALFDALRECNVEPDTVIGGVSYNRLREDLLQCADRMSRNSQRIGRIVSNLHAIVKKEPRRDEDVDLNATVVSALSVIEHIVKRTTRSLRLDLLTPLPLVKGNSQQLEQVVINLVRNGCQALADMDRSVKIATSYDAVRGRVILTVADEGHGMDEEMCKKALTPFFSTKGVEGTGLGLCICKNLVALHDGDLTIESHPGRGTTVRVSLPINRPDGRQAVGSTLL